MPDLVSRIGALPGRRVVVGVAGCPGAGKTTLVAALRDAVAAEHGADAVAHVPMDGFHLADVELARLGRAGRKGAPDTFDVGGYVALLRRIRARDEDVVLAPMFERDLEQAVAGAIPVPRAARVVLTEGNYLLLDEPGWREVRAELDEVWFCAVDDDLRRARLTARHVRFGRTPAEAAAWVAAVDDPNAVLVEATRGRADLVVRVG
ncbi:nucleoside/nucleotide kinase family protein [Pseudonocardia sp. KRD-169]|uniref:Nucleoside/nucleotide kinase family protein n=1 Tax=Pseudonocardia abyssalis TaxID=2792008 RepID=A0ABS6UQN5_9PSEU|nr:nucleoside/nucleotide kinase family protein [Pseudonocardia abyssalis]MBW0134492.1 nucleoside/nucleotide kinase family protein [Pseudonocardia abyssalis]